MKELLIENSFTQGKQVSNGRRKGTELLVLQFKEDKLIQKLNFQDVESAREKIYPKGRYNYLHCRFTEAKRRGKKVLHIKNSGIGEVFIIKKKEIHELSSILNTYLNE